MFLPLDSVLPSLAALAAVLGLAVLAGRLARRGGFAQPPGARRLALQDTLPLDRARRLQIVRCDGQDVVLLTGGGADLVVGWLPHGPPAVADPASAGAQGAAP